MTSADNRFRLAVKAAGAARVMHWLAGPDKLRTFFNQAWLDFSGRTLEQELENGWTEGVHADDLRRCFETYSAAFDARRSFQIEYRLRRFDGGYQWVLDNGSPQFGPDGAFLGYSGVCVDASSIKQSHEAEFAAQKLQSLGLMTRSIAHDFGNMLSGIVAHAEYMLDNLRPHSPRRKDAQAILGIALRGSEIVHELMIYNEGAKPGLELLDVSALAREMLELLKISIPRQAILETHLKRGLPPVLASATHIRQILINLIINASEAIGDKPGKIEISTSHIASSTEGRNGDGRASVPGGDYVRLLVSDTGSGMKPEAQESAMEPHFTTKPQGRGLGLAAMQTAIGGYGGFIRVESAPQGSRFEIILPAASDRQNRSARTARAVRAI